MQGSGLFQVLKSSEFVTGLSVKMEIDLCTWNNIVVIGKKSTQVFLNIKNFPDKWTKLKAFTWPHVGFVLDCACKRTHFC